MAGWQEAPLQRDQLVLFSETLEQRIPQDHSVRLLDELLDLEDWSEWEAEYNGHLGQPPIHPKILCKVLLYGMLRGIRTTRTLEYCVRHNVDFIWLVSGRSIDHTTLNKFRSGHTKQLEKLYRSVCRKALRLGVARLAEVCIDGSRVLGNASRFKTLTGPKVEKLLEELDRQVAARLQEYQLNDEVDELLGEEGDDKLPPGIAEMHQRRAQLQQLREELSRMDAERRQDGIDPQKNPAQLSTTDPDARILPNKSGGYAPNYTPMAVVETENGFIVGADVLVGNVEHTVAMALLDGLESDYGERVEAVLADGVYATGPNIAECEARSIELLSPLPNDAPADNPADREDPTQPVPEEQWDRLPLNKTTKRFDKQAFVYDEEKDCYYCPDGRELQYSHSEKVKVHGRQVQRRNFQCSSCKGCSLVSRCRTDVNARNGRRVRHDEFESHRRRHRAKMREATKQARYAKRLHYGETPFAFIKQWMNVRQFLLRGIEKVKTEWLWCCTAYNLKKLMSFWKIIRAGHGEMLLKTEG